VPGTGPRRGGQCGAGDRAGAGRSVRCRGPGRGGAVSAVPGDRAGAGPGRSVRCRGTGAGRGGQCGAGAVDRRVFSRATAPGLESGELPLPHLGD
jgi:hypothetical protein